MAATYQLLRARSAIRYTLRRPPHTHGSIDPRQPSAAYTHNVHARAACVTNAHLSISEYNCVFFTWRTGPDSPAAPSTSMGKRKQRQAEDVAQAPGKQQKLANGAAAAAPPAPQPTAAAAAAGGGGPSFKNKEKVLVLGTRGITFRCVGGTCSCTAARLLVCHV